MSEWAHPLPANEPEWQGTLERRREALQAARDELMAAYQIAGKQGCGLAEDALGAASDHISNAIDKINEGIELISQGEV